MSREHNHRLRTKGKERKGDPKKPWKKPVEEESKKIG